MPAKNNRRKSSKSRVKTPVLHFFDPTLTVLNPLTKEPVKAPDGEEDLTTGKLLAGALISMPVKGKTFGLDVFELIQAITSADGPVQITGAQRRIIEKRMNDQVFTPLGISALCQAMNLDGTEEDQEDGEE